MRYIMLDERERLVVQKKLGFCKVHLELQISYLFGYKMGLSNI